MKTKKQLLLEEEEKIKLNRKKKDDPTDDPTDDPVDDPQPSIVASFASGDMDATRELIKQRAMDKVVELVREL